MSRSGINARRSAGTHRAPAGWKTIDGPAKRPLAVALTIGMLLFGSGSVAYASSEAQTSDQTTDQSSATDTTQDTDNTQGSEASDDAGTSGNNPQTESDKTTDSSGDSTNESSDKKADSEKKSADKEDSGSSSKKSDEASAPATKSSEQSADETTNLRIYRTVDGDSSKIGFSFEATSVVGAKMSAPTTHKTDGQGRAGVYTLKAAAGSASTVTFMERALDGSQSYELKDAQCYWGKTVDTNAQKLDTKVLSGSTFKVDVPVLDDKNKQDVACAIDIATVAKDTPKTAEASQAAEPEATDDPSTGASDDASTDPSADATDEPSADPNADPTDGSTADEVVTDGFVASNALKARALLADAPTTAANPSVAAVCGINLVLTFDISGSVSDQLTTMKTAGKSFVDALGGMRGKIAVTSFATAAQQNLAFTPMSSAQAIKNAIDALAIPSGNAQFTNWQAGLTTAQSTANSATGNSLGTVVIFITDGDPNRTGSGVEADTETAVNAAIPVANAIKSSGKRVFGLSVGTSNSQHQRVQQISGPTPLSSGTFLTTDYTTINSYGALQTELAKIAKDLCGGKVTIQKNLEKLDNTSVGQPNIEFGAVASAPGTIANQPAKTDANGGTEVKVDLPSSASSANVTLTEKTTSDDWTLSSVVCDGKPVTLNGSSWTVAVKDDAAVGCVVTNKEVQKYGDLTLTKNVQVRPSDNTVASSFKLFAKDSKGEASIAEVPTKNASSDGLTASTAKTQVKAGDYNLSETMKDGSAVSPTQYLTSDWTCTSNGQTIAVTGGVVKVAVGADVKCEVTNTARNAEQTTNLTIQKLINGQNAAQGFIFTGSAVNQQDVTIPVTPDSHSTDGQGRAGEFTFKTAKDEAIVATFVESFVQQGSNAITDPYVIDSARCWYSDAGFKEKITELTDVVVSDDGTSFTVTIPQMDNKNKQEILCDVNNITPTGKLTLVKNVINDNGGTLLAKDFTLKATGPIAIEQKATENTQNSGLTGSVIKTVPVGKYTLDELVQDGYAPSDWTCAGSDAVVKEVMVTYKSNVVCSITNDDKAGELTLVKKVVNDNGGTALASDFTLIAGSHSGKPTVVPGTDNLEANITFTVDAGTYALDEDGPAGYKGSGWTCAPVGDHQAKSAVGTTGEVTVANGQTVKCTITNDDKAGKLILVKKVVNDNGGSATAAQFTLTADGPKTDLSGPADQNLSSDGLTGEISGPVNAGTYTLSEDGPAGYKGSGWTCAPVGDHQAKSAVGTTGEVTVANGQTVKCTITNDDKQGTLILVKKVVNDNGGSATADLFTLTADGPKTDLSGPADQNLSSDGLTGEISGPVDAGTYTLSEDGPDGYKPGSWTCAPSGERQEKNGDTTDQVTVANGQTVKCTITNDDIASVIDVDKEIGENGIQRIGNDTFRAEYTVKVTSEGVHPNSYTLEDQPSLPAGAELLKVTAAKTADVPDSIELESDFDGVDHSVIVKDAPIAGGATHTYTVVVEFKIPLAEAADVVRTCDVETPGTGGAYNEATISVEGQDPKSDDACIDIPERPVVNLGITKEALSPEPGSMVEAAEDVTYAITVTNNLDETAYAVRITDDLPDELQFKEITDLPAGWTHTVDPDGTHVISNPDGIAGGESITFNLVATYVPTETSEPTEIVNTACVESVGYENEAAGEDGKACDTEIVKVASLVAEVGPICEAGIPALDFKLTGTNFEFTPGQEITVTWKSADGLTVLHQQTVSAEEAGAIANGSLVWPGVTLDSDGAPTSWPGYRAVVAGETPDFLNFIKDDSVDSAKFLAPMKIEFSVNPTTSASVELGALSPDCFVGFTGSPEIEKTASVENIQPNKDFTYTLSTSNSGNGVLTDAVLVDEIPDNIAVKNISVDTTAFPTWENCEVTGAIGGKGGTLKCELNGPAAANSELPDVVLTVAATGDFPSDESVTIVNTAQLCANVTASAEEATCVEDEVPVKVIGSGEKPQVITPEPTEEPTVEPTPDSSEEPEELVQTGFNTAPALWAAGLLIAGVTLAAGVNRRRGHRE